jgi:hydroxymethylglutaryl-CoA lyase
MSDIQLVECPRDAMQGISKFISTNEKIKYINSLIDVGFDIIDFGSFVSPKSVPQMKDTEEVLSKLKLNKKTSLLAVIVNEQGATKASSFPEIKYLGYPFSISETFQLKNSNKKINESLFLIEKIQNMCSKSNQELLVYISMAFGNIYNDTYSISILLEYIQRLIQLGVKNFTLADTIGIADKNIIYDVFLELNKINQAVFGLHLHTEKKSAIAKIESAWGAGCRRFDSTIRGFGGCPFAKKELIGNLPTEYLINFIQTKKIKHKLDLLSLETAYNNSMNIFKLT